MLRLSWLRRWREPTFAFRPASVADVPAMVRLFGGEVAAGHFGRFSEGMLATQLEFAAARGRIPNVSDVVRLDVVTERGEPVGYSVARDLPFSRPGVALPVLELWLAGVTPAARGRGAGGQLVAHVLAREPADRDVLARLYPVSTRMRALLARHGFVELGRDRNGLAMLFRGIATDRAWMRARFTLGDAPHS